MAAKKKPRMVQLGRGTVRPDLINEKAVSISNDLWNLGVQGLIVDWLDLRGKKIRLIAEVLE